MEEKKSKTLSEVKLVKKISKNLQSFLEVSTTKKEVPPLTPAESPRSNEIAEWITRRPPLSCVKSATFNVPLMQKKQSTSFDSSRIPTE